MNPELPGSPQVGSQSTAHHACSCSLSLTFHMCVQGLQSWLSWAVGHSQQLCIFEYVVLFLLILPFPLSLKFALSTIFIHTK